MHVVDVGVAPLVDIRQPERPAVAGRAAEVDVEDGEPLAHEDLLERQPRPEACQVGSAVRIDDRRDPRAAALAGRRGRPHRLPSIRRPSRALKTTRSAGTRERRRTEDRGQVRSRWRGRAPSAPPGHRQQPEVLRPALALADRRDPRAVGQSSRRLARRRPWVYDPAAPAATAGRGSLRRPAAAALRRRPRQRGDDEIADAVLDLDVDEPRAVRRRRAARSRTAAGRLAVLARAGRERRPVAASRRIDPDDLEPAVGVGHEEQVAVGQPARARIPSRRRRRSGRSAPVATSTTMDLRRQPVLALARRSRSGGRRATSRGRRRRPGGGQGARLGRLRARWRAGRAGDRGIDRPRPATSRAGARRRPARWPSGDQRGPSRRPDARSPVRAASHRPRPPRSRRRGRTRGGGRRATTADR